ncbi:hypothetical protein TrCOL_g12889 [Triparma columacea]|uniref:Conserved virulence factor B-like winged helix domain-containing protein n=1 Tax=Triparma columacea TaxID=722753 RepID=A0A9W7FZT9_9STRA|nr:hypothetical protein TrCOL_g12889 [Triparma columacea]
MLLSRISTTGAFFRTIVTRSVGRSLTYRSSPLCANFRPGEKFIVEVDHFGPLGASVNILKDDSEDAEIIGSGLILQRDIHKFRESRDNVDVVVGELLDGFCQRDRREDGRVDISLFPVGINKLNSVRDMILAELDQCNGRLDIGEKSSPEVIEEVFGVGVSKSNFKKALGMLYSEQLIKRPGANEVELL